MTSSYFESLSHNVLALWINVRITLFLCSNGWLLPKLRYLSVCVGLRYMLKERRPLIFLLIFKSKKFKHEFSSISSVNYIWLLIELISEREDEMLSFSIQAITSSTKRYQKSSFPWRSSVICYSRLCITISAITTDTGDPIGVPEIYL